MAKELVHDFKDVTARNLDIAAIIGKILPRGHVIHGYSSASSKRLLMVLETTDYSDSAPLLGFGVDGSAERSLARALLTYAIREQRGLDYITEKQLPESHEGGLPPGNNNSRFDTIVWNGDFKLYQDGEDYVAWSNFGSGVDGMRPTEVHATNAEGAVGLLADSYDFPSPTIRSLPVMSLDYLPFH